jgi:hypothetical protein
MAASGVRRQRITLKTREKRQEKISYPRCGNRLYLCRAWLVGGRLLGTLSWRSWVRFLRARLVTSHSGAAGDPPGRHYGRSAGSLLDLAGAKSSESRKRGPGGEKYRGGAPRGETHRSQGACRASQARFVWCAFSALRSPSCLGKERGDRRARAANNRAGGAVLLRPHPEEPPKAASRRTRAACMVRDAPGRSSP